MERWSGLKLFLGMAKEILRSRLKSMPSKLCWAVILSLFFSTSAYSIFRPVQLDQLIAPPAEARSTYVKKRFSVQQAQPELGMRQIRVSSAAQLYQAVAKANQNGGDTAIYLENGVYFLPHTLQIQADNVWLLSSSATPYQVVLKGLGMKRTSKVQNLIRVSSNHFLLDGITLTDSPNHLIQIAGELGASYPTIRNSILQDAYEQLIKVSYNLKTKPEQRSYGGEVEHCVFQYSKGMAPNYYTGGIDALGSVGWRVEHNVFRDIASPGKHIAQHAVHFWTNSEDNQILNNLFIDNDRAIGFGMVLGRTKPENFSYHHKGGRIAGNTIYHAANGDPYADAGIILEASPDAVIIGNHIYHEHRYPRAIEYRFAATQNVRIEGNHTNKLISSRNNGRAELINNIITLSGGGFSQALSATLKRLGIVTLHSPVVKQADGSSTTTEITGE